MSRQRERRASGCRVGGVLRSKLAYLGLRPALGRQEIVYHRVWLLLSPSRSGQATGKRLWQQVRGTGDYRFTRSFDQRLQNGERWAWISRYVHGRIGQIDARHVEKDEAREACSLFKSVAGYGIGVSGGSPPASYRERMRKNSILMRSNVAMRRWNKR